jgi:hypothetical protein
LNTKEQEIIKKVEKLEKKQLQAKEEYWEKLAEERTQRENDFKAKEKLKQQKLQEFTKNPSIPSMPNLGNVNIPP